LRAGRLMMRFEQVPYVICQFPANIICRRLGPCLWLPLLAVSWGIVTLGVGFTTDWTQLIACRILLGVLEV
jgi:MFS family permease